MASATIQAIPSEVPRFPTSSKNNATVVTLETAGFEEMLHQVFSAEPASSAPGAAASAAPLPNLDWLPSWMPEVRHRGSRLPAELISLLQHRPRWVVTVRGGRGSGALDLAIAMLARHDGTRRLISARSPVQDLVNQYPLLSVMSESNEGLDTIDVSPLAPLGLEPSPGQLPVPGYLARLQRKRGDAQVMLVIHGWTSLIDRTAEVFNRPGNTPSEHGMIERRLLARLRECADRIVILPEEGSDSWVDGRVDGDLLLHKDMIDDHPVHEMEIVQLDGVEVARARHAFTLANGSFESIPTIAPGYRTRGVFSPCTTPMGPHAIWPGSLALARVFGPLRAGGITFLEADRDVPNDVQHLLGEPVLQANLAQGSRVVVFTDHRGDPERLARHLARNVPSNLIEQKLRLVSMFPSTAPGEARLPYVIPLQAPAEGSSGLLYEQLAEFLAESDDDDAPSIIMMDASALWIASSRLGAPLDPASFISSLAEKVQNRPIAEVIWGSPEDRMAPELRRLAATHVRLRQFHGATVLYGVRPWTGAHFLVPGAANPNEQEPYQLVAAS